MKTANTENNRLEWLLPRIEYLSGFMTDERNAVLREVLARRTRYMTLCTENTFHSQNASALVRNCEAFGIQDIHAVESLCSFAPHVRIARGTDQWIDIHKYPSTTELIAALRRANYRIVATSPHAEGTTPETFDVNRGPFALVFGTEHAGISEEMMAAADEYILIPMCGFVESLNVSASAAILLYQLSQRIRNSTVQWTLNELEKAETLFRWMMNTVRDADNILLRFEQDRNPQAD